MWFALLPLALADDPQPLSASEVLDFVDTRPLRHPDDWRPVPLTRVNMADQGPIELRMTHDARMEGIAKTKAMMSCGGSVPAPRRTFGLMPLVLRSEEDWAPVILVRMALVARPPADPTVDTQATRIAEITALKEQLRSGW